MKRVMIIGNAGGGKSRLADALAARHGLPLIRLDDLIWKPGWQPTPIAEFETAHAAILQTDTWLIDGWGPEATLPARMAAADTLYFVDLPFRTHLWFATKRQFKSLFREMGPTGCPMWKVTLPLYRMMWELHRHGRGRLHAFIAAAPHLELMHIQSVSALNAACDAAQ